MRGRRVTLLATNWPYALQTAISSKRSFPNEPYRSPDKEKLMLMREMAKNSGELKDLFKNLEDNR